MANKDMTKFERLLYVIESTREESNDGETVWFVDDIGKTYEVHKDGRLFVRLAGSHTWTQSVDQTSSQKRYKYENVFLRIGKGIDKYTVGRHDLMGWVFRMDEFKNLLDTGIDINKIHLCHVDGDGHNNALSNVQWGTCTENKLQASIVNGLESAFPGLYTEHDYFYGVTYVTVEGGIRNEWIYEYFGEMKKGSRLWTPATLQSFVDFLYKRGYWKNILKGERHENKGQ